MNQNRQLIVIVLDISSSMSSRMTKTNQAVKDFVETQKLAARQTGREIFIKYVLFDDTVRDSGYPENILSFNWRDQHVGGSTALYDAIDIAINSAEAWFDSKPFHDRPGIITVNIFTDGEENASTRFTPAESAMTTENRTNAYAARTKQRIDYLEALNGWDKLKPRWDFLFGLIGGNAAMEAAAAKIGGKKNKIQSFSGNPEDMRKAVMRTSQVITAIGNGELGSDDEYFG